MNVGREKIEYFTNKGAAEKSETPSGTIDLLNFKGVKKFDDLTFQLDGGSDGVFLLRADSNAEMTMWINSLEVYLKDKIVSFLRNCFSVRLLLSKFSFVKVKIFQQQNRSCSFSRRSQMD